MRFLTALPVVVLLVLVDALLIVSFAGLIVISDQRGPFSFTFARDVWGKR